MDIRIENDRPFLETNRFVTEFMFPDLCTLPDQWQKAIGLMFLMRFSTRETAIDFISKVCAISSEDVKILYLPVTDPDCNKQYHNAISELYTFYPDPFKMMYEGALQRYYNSAIALKEMKVDATSEDKEFDRGHKLSTSISELTQQLKIIHEQSTIMPDIKTKQESIGFLSKKLIQKKLNGDTKQRTDSKI